MIGDVLQHADLQELCRPGQQPRLATVERWARSIGLAVTYDGRGGLLSSVQALNRALGLDAAANDAGAAFTPPDSLV